MKAVNRNLGKVVFFRPACKSWNCPGCAPNLKKRWVYAAQHGATVLMSEGHAIDFLTVTSHEKLNAAGSLAILSSAWHKLARRVMHVSDSHEYFLIPEQHQDGRWHIHALITANLKKRWWKDNARACGFGYQSDVQEVQSLGGTYHYVSKYLGKTLQSTNLPKHFRRVRLSQGWPGLPELSSPPGWNFMLLERDRGLSWDAERYQKEGFQVFVADPESAWEIVEGMDVISG